MARVRAGIRIKAMQRVLEESQQQIIRQEKLATIGHLASGISHAVMFGVLPTLTAES